MRAVDDDIYHVMVIDKAAFNKQDGKYCLSSKRVSLLFTWCDFCNGHFNGRGNMGGVPWSGIYFIEKLLSIEFCILFIIGQLMIVYEY